MNTQINRSELSYLETASGLDIVYKDSLPPGIPSIPVQENDPVFMLVHLFLDESGVVEFAQSTGIFSSVQHEDEFDESDPSMLCSWHSIDDLSWTPNNEGDPL